MSHEVQLGLNLVPQVWHTIQRDATRGSAPSSPTAPAKSAL